MWGYLPQIQHNVQFCVHIVEKYCTEYRNLTELGLVLLSISCGTGPLERSYAKLAKICCKGRCNISSFRDFVLTCNARCGKWWILV